MFHFLLRIFWCRNFCDTAEISTKIMRNRSKSTIQLQYGKTINVKHMRSHNADILMPKFLRYDRNFCQSGKKKHKITLNTVEISTMHQKFLHWDIDNKIPHLFHIHHFPISRLFTPFCVISHYFGRNFCHIAEISAPKYSQQKLEHIIYFRWICCI